MSGLQIGAVRIRFRVLLPCKATLSSENQSSVSTEANESYPQGETGAFGAPRSLLAPVVALQEPGPQDRCIIRDNRSNSLIHDPPWCEKKRSDYGGATHR